MRGAIARTAVMATVLFLTMAPSPGWAQAKKLVFWTHWEQNPEFNKFYETRGKDFAQKHGYEVQVVTVPYQGYEAKYLAALIGKSGAPDIFMGMTHHWCGQYDFCDRMPADLAKVWDDNLPKYMVSVGKWKGVRYGIPIEHGNFQQMYISADLLQQPKVASLGFPTSEDAFGQKRAGVIFRESWFFGWVKKNAPDVRFKVYALPCGKTCPGAGNLFPWTNMVYKNSPNKQAAWDFLKFISNAKDDLDQHQAQGILPVWTANLDSAYVKSRPDYQSTQEMLKQPVPPEYYHPKSNELATALGEAVVAALYGRGQPKALLDEAAARMDRILKD